jgi:hypothetical protein
VRGPLAEGLSPVAAIAVVAHSRKSLGGGLSELREILAREGVTDPPVVRGEQEPPSSQVRAPGGG